MRKIVLLICITALQLASMGQVIDTTSHETNLGFEYAQRSKNGRVAGFILLGVGSAATYLGTKTMLSNLFSGGHEGEGAAITGALMVVASIPVFIIAGSNKRKSMLHLRQSKVKTYTGNNFGQQMALVWKLNL